MRCVSKIIVTKNFPWLALPRHETNYDFTRTLAQMACHALGLAKSGAKKKSKEQTNAKENPDRRHTLPTRTSWN